MSALQETMEGEVVLVTGATSGIGKATAEALAKLGATVVVTGRNEERGRAAVSDIRATSGNTNVELMLADLSSLAETRRLAEEFRSRYDRLDVLVNNAGGGSQQRVATADGYELSFALNVLSPFLLTSLLESLLKNSAPARVVNVNTGSLPLVRPDFDDLQTERSFSGMGAYMRSKTANLLWTYELARRLEGTGVTVYAVNPGAADTELNRTVQEGMPRAMRTLSPIVDRFMKTPEKATVSSIRAATAPELVATTGVYLGPNGRVARSSKASHDEAAAKRLWKISAGMTGMAPQSQNKISTVHVDDLADLYVRALEHGPAGTLFNAVGPGPSVTMKQVAEAIA